MEARELSAAVSRASELGVTELTIASPGPRARAAATYAACAGLGCHVFVPEGADPGIVADCETLGARVEVTGDGPARARDGAERHGWVDVSAFAEPYGIEGSKTIAYELYEQLAWTLPDAVVFPDRAGTTREGIAKGLDEMEELGWIDDQRPGMVVAAEEATAELVALAARTTGLIPSRRAAATLATLRTAVDEHTVA
jgi:threonine synthase